MADNEKTDMTVEAAQPLNDTQDALAKFEAQRMTRRQALAKVGLRFGAAAVALLSVDELARKAGAVLQSNAHGNKVVEQVAREMQKAGVAFANTRSCQHCWNQLGIDDAACDAADTLCLQGGASPHDCNVAYHSCNNAATSNFNDCFAAHCQ